MVDRYPVIIAANRDEHYDRPSAPPALWSTRPKILAGKDLLAGGTWLGVNEHGLLVGILNRRSNSEPDPLTQTRSRGLLCLDLLEPQIRRGRPCIRKPARRSISAVYRCFCRSERGVDRIQRPADRSRPINSMKDCTSTVAPPSSLCDLKKSIGPTCSSLKSSKSCDQTAATKRCGCVLCARCSAITRWVTVPMILGTLFVFMETSPAPFLLRLSFIDQLEQRLYTFNCPGTPCRGAFRRSPRAECPMKGQHKSRLAATVILLRPAESNGFEVFLTRRPDEMAFLGGMYCFPGGALRKDDCSPAMLRHLPRFVTRRCTKNRWRSIFAARSFRTMDCRYSRALRRGGNLARG